MRNLVSTDWLQQNLENVRLLDASWHMPSSNREPEKEFNTAHIKNTLFFDLDKHSCQKSSLPHMLPEKDAWEKTISKFGIKNSDHVIIYDNSDVISSCRVWYNFLYYSHNPDLISVLDGGLKKWIKEKKEVTNNINLFPESSYVAKAKPYMVLNKKQIELNIKNNIFEIIDARSKERFQGLHPEPRKELRSGNIEGSKNIPFMELINIEDRTFKSKNEIKFIFDKLDLNQDKDIAYTCGSGVTACILALANSIISGKNPVIYDGSWSEYGIK